jgi:hypothetical protein
LVVFVAVPLQLGQQSANFPVPNDELVHSGPRLFFLQFEQVVVAQALLFLHVN